MVHVLQPILFQTEVENSAMRSWHPVPATKHKRYGSITVLSTVQWSHLVFFYQINNTFASVSLCRQDHGYVQRGRRGIEKDCLVVSD